MIRFSLLSLAALAAAPVPALAQDTTPQPQVEVTASRVAETVDATLADVSVITRADIDTSGARDLVDLLRLQAGVDFARTGGPGAQTAVFLRGTNSNHVLVLIDGVRIASTGTGAYAFENLPLDAVERVEIVRGPRASYWGSDAIGGVIQIFTRRLTGPHLAAGYGTYQDADGSVGYGAWNERGGFSVQAGWRHVTGFSAQNPAGYAYDPDNDGMRQRNVAARGNAVLGSQTLGVTLLRSDGEVEFDEGTSHMIDQTAGVTLSGTLADGWQHRLNVGSSRDDLDTPDFASLFLSRRQTLSWQNEFTLDPQQRLIAGIDYVHEKGVSRDTSADVDQYDKIRDNTGVFGGWQTNIGAFDSELSARHDHNSAFGDATTGSAALGWRFAPEFRAYASFGQGFRAPGLDELFSPGYGGYYAGNPGLRPERSHSSELGLEFVPGAGQRLSAHLFSTRVRDLIDFTGPQNEAENVDRAAIDGAELAYDLAHGDWRLHATWTWQNPRDADTGAQLLRRPKQKFGGSLDRVFGERLSAGVEFVAAGRRDDVGDVRLPTYALVNLRASYALNADWRLVGRIENLGDRDYELVHGFNTPRRSGFLEVIWSPQR